MYPEEIYNDYFVLTFSICIKLLTLNGPLNGNKNLYNILNTEFSKFSKAAMTPFCQLCTKAVEDIRHFLLDCEKLNDVRQKHYDSLVDYLRSLLGGDITVQLEKEQLLNILLDCSNVPQLFAMKTDDKLKLERKTQNFCYYLHMKRATMLMSRQ